MFRKSVITLVICLLTSFCQTIAKDNPSQISMHIGQLDNRIPVPKEGRSGILALRFDNEGQEDVALQFAFPLSFGGYGVLESYKLMPVDSFYWKLPYGSRSAGASASVIDYHWRDSSGQEVLTGTYDVSQPSHRLNKGAFFHIYVPIAIPVKAGSYLLSVHFDSRHMIYAVESRSSSTEMDRLGCFEATSTASIVLK